MVGKTRRLALAALAALGAAGPAPAAAVSTPVFSGGLLDGLPSYVPRDPFSGQSLHAEGQAPPKTTHRTVVLRSTSVTDVKQVDDKDGKLKTLTSVPSYAPQEPFSQLDA